MECKVEVPKDLIKELKNPSRKRPIKAILRENWSLIEEIDNQFKNVNEFPENLPPLVVHVMKNFMTTISFLINPRKLSIRKRKTTNEPPDEILDFEYNLRDAQKNWRHFFDKFEKDIHIFVQQSKKIADVNFHEELWQKTKLQKLTSAIANLSEKIQTKTVSFIPPSRFLFAFIGFIASWTIVPVFNTPKKLTAATTRLLKIQEMEPENEIYKAKQNGTVLSPEPSMPKLIITPQEINTSMTKFHENMKQSEKFIAEKEQEWQEKLNKYQKEISARLEVQEKRLTAEIEQFEEDKESRRKQEEEEFARRMEQQDIEFQKIIRKIDIERKKFSEEEHQKLLETCQKQDDDLLDLLDSSLKPSLCHWEDHEDYWSSRLQIMRNTLSLIRSEFWNFERYFRQYTESTDTSPHFVRTVFEMESSSFGQTVTRAQTLINNQHEFFDILFDKYDDDFFLKVLWKITSNVSNQLDKVILELWSIAVNSKGYDRFQLRSAVLDIDPYSIPTTWRLKGICHSADPSDYEDALSNGSPSAYSHF